MLTQLRKECNLGPVQCFALFGYDSTDLLQGAPNHSLTKQLSEEFLILPHIKVALKRSKNVKHILVHCSRNNNNNHKTPKFFCKMMLATITFCSQGQSNACLLGTSASLLLLSTSEKA